MARSALPPFPPSPAQRRNRLKRQQDSHDVQPFAVTEVVLRVFHLALARKGILIALLVPRGMELGGEMGEGRRQDGGRRLDGYDRGRQRHSRDEGREAFEEGPNAGRDGRRPSRRFVE
jgi:hypothetical protein